MDPHGHPSNLGNYPGIQQHGKVPGYPGYGTAGSVYAQQSQLYGMPPVSMSQFGGPGYQAYQHPGIRMSGSIPSSYDMYGLSNYPGSQTLDQATRWSQQNDPYAAQMLNGIPMGHPSHYTTTRTQTQPSYTDPGIRQASSLYAPNQSMSSLQNSAAQAAPRHAVPDYGRYQPTGGTVSSHPAPRQVTPSAHSLYMDRGPAPQDPSQRMMYEQTLSQPSQQQPNLSQFDTSPNRSAFNASAPTAPSRSRYEAPKPTSHQPQATADPTRYDIAQPTYTSLDSNKYSQYKGSFEQPHSSLRYPNPQPQSSHYPQPGGASIADPNRHFSAQSYGASLSQSTSHMGLQHDPYNMQPPLSSDPYRTTQGGRSQYQSSYPQATGVPTKQVYSTAPSNDSHLKQLEQMIPQVPSASSQNPQAQPLLSHQFASPVTPVTPQPPTSVTPQPPTGCVTPQPVLTNTAASAATAQPKPNQNPASDRYPYNVNEGYAPQKPHPVLVYQQPGVTASSVSHSVDRLMSSEPAKAVAESISPMQTHFTISEALERLERMEEDDQEQVVINERFSLSLFPGERPSPTKQTPHEQPKVVSEPSLEQQEAEKRYSDEMKEAAANLAALADDITFQIGKETGDAAPEEVRPEKTLQEESERQLIQPSPKVLPVIPESQPHAEAPKQSPNLASTPGLSAPRRHPMSVESLVTLSDVVIAQSTVEPPPASASYYSASNLYQPDPATSYDAVQSYDYAKVRSSSASFVGAAGSFDSFQKLAEFTSREISQFAAQEAQFRPPSSHSAAANMEVSKLTEHLSREQNSSTQSPFRPPSTPAQSGAQEGAMAASVPAPSPSQKSRPTSRQSLPSSDVNEARSDSVPAVTSHQSRSNEYLLAAQEAGLVQTPVSASQAHESFPLKQSMSHPIPAEPVQPVPLSSSVDQQYSSYVPDQQFSYGSNQGLIPTSVPSAPIPASGTQGVPNKGDQPRVQKPLVPASPTGYDPPTRFPYDQQIPRLPSSSASPQKDLNNPSSKGQAGQEHMYPPMGLHPQHAEKLVNQAQMLQYQLQQLYMMPPNPETQIQVTELEELFAGIQNQLMYAAAPPGYQAGMMGYPPHGMMGSMPQQMGMAHGYPGQQGMPPEGMMGEEEEQETGKKGRKRKPKDPNAPKGKPGRKKKVPDTPPMVNPMPMPVPAMPVQVLQPPPKPDLVRDAYHFSDSPEASAFQETPAETKTKKPRKPRTPKSPKPSEPVVTNGEGEGDTPGKKKRPYKRKGKAAEEPEVEPIQAIEEPPEIIADAVSEVPETVDPQPVPAEEDVDFDEDMPLSKKKEKKPRIKQSTPSKKRPSKTMLQFKKNKKKRGSDDENDDNDDDDRSSPFQEPDDAYKRRSGRTANTEKKKYTEAVMDFEQEIETPAAGRQIGSNDDESLTGPDALDRVAPRNKEEESMIVHYVLNSRMGTRELEDDEPDEEKENQEKSGEKHIEIEVDDKEKERPKTVEVEEFYVKYKHLSYLHCEWKTEEELLRVDKRIPQKIRRFKLKRAQAANMFEFLEEESFNPDYVEVDRVLDESVSTDPATGQTVRHFLVKWRALAYEDATWELEEDVDQNKIKLFRDFNKVPPKDQLKRKGRPKPSEWKKLEESPVYLGGNTLREYQLEGLNWLLFSWYNSRNCILADEMGLGKTIQSLTFIEAVFKYGIRGPFLVVAPLSTIPNWQREIETWTNMNVIVYHGSSISRNMISEYELYFKDENGKKVKDAFKFNVLITTFEVIITDCAELKSFPWRLCVIDEAHRLKNKNCKLLEGLRLLNTDHRVLLSGTPLQNNISELFSLLNFLEPSQFSNGDQFLSEFGDLQTEDQVQRLQALLKPMMLRRLKEDVEKSLAPKTETIVEVELTNIQKKYYRGILERNFSFLQKGTSYQNIPNLMNTMMELRKCCIHPFLLNGAEDQIQYDMKQSREAHDHDELYFNSLVQSSGKLVLVDKLLPKLKASGHRVLIFSQMVKCLDILEDYLIHRKYPYERIDGRITGNLRQAAIDRYSKPDSDRFVFLLCTKAGGLGINLTAADTVIIYDSDWNPQNDLQAQARCHRIGQSKTVKVYRLITRNTYEREMFDKASKKLGLDKAVLQSMNTSQGTRPDKEFQAAGIAGAGGIGKQLSKKEIEDLLKKGAYGAIMDDDNAGDKFCEEDIDQILERRTQVITVEAEKGSSFSKATFSSKRDRTDIDIDDPDFWKKWAKKADIDVVKDVKLDLMISEPRRRTQIKRYGENDNAEMSELGSSSKSGASDGEELEGGLTGRAKKRLKRRSRRGDDDSSQDESTKGWAKSDCFKVEKGLLTYGWGRWDDVMQHSQFRQNFSVEDVMECSRVILLYSLQQYKGDERIKSFIMDLIAPSREGDSEKPMRNHTGLSAPVPRGRKGKKKLGGDEEQAFFDSFAWALDAKYNGESVLCAPYQRHLIRHSNKVLLRVRMLYYIRQEVIGELADQIQKGALASQLPIYPPPCDQPPALWWDTKADISLLVGTYKHGYERYAVMRSDPTLVFLAKCGPPDGADLMKEIEAANAEDLDKDDENDEDDNTNDESPSETPRETPGETPSQSPATSVADSEKLPWPTAADLNARLRRIVTAYQRKFKKEELRNAQKAKRVERRERIELVTREQEPTLPKMAPQTMKRWSRKEERDFFHALCTFGVDYNRSIGRYDWTRFRAVAHLEHKSDDALTEYLRAFCAMCKKVSGRKMDENEEIAQSLVESVSPAKAQRCLERLELLCKIREEVLLLPDLDARLELCEESKDTPDWWKCGTHDKDLLLAAARHGLKGTSLYYLNAPELGFREILRRLLAGEPLADKKPRAAPKVEKDQDEVEKKPLRVEVNGGLKVENEEGSTNNKKEPETSVDMKVENTQDKEGKETHDDETDRASSAPAHDVTAAETPAKATEPVIQETKPKEEPGVKTEPAAHNDKDEEEPKPKAFVIDPQMLAMAATDPAAAQLLAQSLADAIGWPKDHSVVARLEHIVYAMEHGKWPVAKSFTAPEDHVLDEPQVQLYPPQKPSAKEAEEGMEIYSFGEEQETPSLQLGSRRRGRRTSMEYELERARLQALLQQQSMQETYLRQYSAKSHASAEAYHPTRSEMESSAAAASLGLPPSISVSVTTKKVEPSSALDLSGPAPKKEMESPGVSDFIKRKPDEAGPSKKRRKLDDIVLGLSAAKSGSKTPDSFVAPALGPAPSVTITRCTGKDSRPPSKLEELDLTSVSIEPVRPKAETPVPKARLPDAALAKLEMSTPPNDQKVSKWLADQAGLTPERPHSPDSEASVEDRRKRGGKKQDPMLLDWNQLTGNETVPVINRLSGKKLVGSKAPTLRNLGQWLLANPAYDVDPNWSEIMKDKMGLSTDTGRRMTGASPANAASPASSSNAQTSHGAKESRKRGPGRPPLHATPSTSGASSLGGMGGYPMSSLGMLDAKTLAMLDPKTLAMLDPKALGALGMLDPKTMAMLDPKSMGMLDPKTLSMMDPKNNPLAAAMDPKFQQMLTGFDPKMLAALDPKMLAGLDPKMLAGMDPKMLAALDPKMFGGMDSKAAAKSQAQLFGGLDPKFFDPKNPLFGSLDPKSMFMPFGAAAALGQFANPLFPQYMGFDMGGGMPSTSKSGGKEDKKNSGGAGSSRGGAPSVSDLNSLFMSNPALLYGSLGMGALGHFGLPPGMHMPFGDMNGMQMMEDKPKTKRSDTPPKSASRASVHEQQHAPCGIDLSKASCSAGPSDDVGAVDLSSTKSSKKGDDHS